MEGEQRGAEGGIIITPRLDAPRLSVQAAPFRFSWRLVSFRWRFDLKTKRFECMRRLEANVFRHMVGAQRHPGGHWAC